MIIVVSTIRAFFHRDNDEIIIRLRLGKADFNVKATGKVAMAVAIGATCIAIVGVAAAAYVLVDSGLASHADVIFRKIFKALISQGAEDLQQSLSELLYT